MPSTPNEIELPATWAVRYKDGRWHTPDSYIGSRTVDPMCAKPFFGDEGWHDAQGFARIWEGSTVVPHPHPELYGGRAPTTAEVEAKASPKPRRARRR